MTIKPEKAYTIVWFCILISIPLAIWYFIDWDMARLVCILAGQVGILVVSFTKAFSIYTLDYKGITQKCVFFTRRFEWDSFKYIGVQRLTKGGTMGASPSYFIRCSTLALPKTMAEKELEEKLYWRPSKTITLPWPDKNGDELYRNFLSYCGGERDIRD